MTTAVEIVVAARARPLADQDGEALVLGCGFGAGDGGVFDDNVMIARCGQVAGRELMERFRDHDTASFADRLQAHIDRLRPARVFLVKGDIGAGVYDLLSTRGNYGRILELVDFGPSAKPVNMKKYRDRGAEIYAAMREWLVDADIPEDPMLLGAELAMIWTASKLQLER